MRSRLTFERRPSPSLVISIIALFVAMGGTSYAALKLPKKSVGTKQLKSNAVTTSKVKNGSLRARDFKAGQLPAGARGATGLTGATGPAGADGTADLFARVETDGGVQPNVAGFPPQNKGIADANIVKGEGAAATGTYCFNIDGVIASAVVSLDNADTAAADRNLVTSVAIDRGEDLGDCPGTHNDARVRIVDGNTAAAQDGRFFIWFER
jgi:hypothetical protein